MYFELETLLDKNIKKSDFPLCSTVSPSDVRVLTKIPVGRGSIVTDDWLCNETATNLEDCLTEFHNDTDCAHKDDIGIDCSGQLLITFKYKRRNFVSFILTSR